MKQLKNSIALFLYSLILSLVKIIPPKKGCNHLLIIKSDEIGDYILFRNLFKYFKKSRRYTGYKITLVGNQAWRKLYQEYDNDCFEQAIWLDKTMFKKNLLYRFSFLKTIRGLHTSDVVNCIFSRSIYLDDGIAYIANGVNKTAMKSDTTNRKPGEKNRDDLIYTKVENAGDEKIFDSVRNRNFVEAIVQMDSLPIDTKLAIIPKNELPKTDYFILFIGAGNPERRWPVNYFIEAARYAASKYNVTPLVCGGPGDEKDALEFMSLYGGAALNYAGKTSLTFMMELLRKARFLICVDTGALHMGVAEGCPVIGLYSGKFYGRFAPYPKEITEQLYIAYPDFVDALIAKKDPILYDTSRMKNDTMKLIPPGKIMPFIDEIMNQQTITFTNK